jgi:hypothetical protein
VVEPLIATCNSVQQLQRSGLRDSEMTAAEKEYFGLTAFLFSSNEVCSQPDLVF